MRKHTKPAGPPPDRPRLHDAALRHLSRFGTTEAGLLRVLERAIQRWAARARQEGHDPDPGARQAKAAARLVASELVQSGVLDDSAFASARAARLSRAGRSQRAIAAHLAAKGVPLEVAGAAVQEGEDELPAALAYARRRRIGPFRLNCGDSETRMSELAALARAGFPRDVAERALNMEHEAAVALVLALKRGQHAG